MAVVIDFQTRQHWQPPVPQPALKEAPRIARQKRGSESTEQRKSLLAKIHVARKQLGLDDDSYRAMLEGHFNVSSAADLTVPKLVQLVQVMASYGFKEKRGSGSKRSRRDAVPANLAYSRRDLAGTRPLLEKLEALLTEKGRTEGTHVPWGYALAVLKRQSGVTRLDDATPEQLRGVIAALVRDAQRHGRRIEG